MENEDVLKKELLSGIGEKFIEWWKVNALFESLVEDMDTFTSDAPYHAKPTDVYPQLEMAKKTVDTLRMQQKTYNELVELTYDYLDVNSEEDL